MLVLEDINGRGWGVEMRCPLSELCDGDYWFHGGLVWTRDEGGAFDHTMVYKVVPAAGGYFSEPHSPRGD